jgi:hypothetical protein
MQHGTTMKIITFLLSGEKKTPICPEKNIFGTDARKATELSGLCREQLHDWHI